MGQQETNVRIGGYLLVIQAQIEALVALLSPQQQKIWQYRLINTCKDLGVNPETGEYYDEATSKENETL